MPGGVEELVGLELELLLKSSMIVPGTIGTEVAMIAGLLMFRSGS